VNEACGAAGRGRRDARAGAPGSVAGLCAELGERPADVALAWLLHRPGVTAPIVGPRTLQQLEDALRAATPTLDAKALEATDAIWPGPGAEAPEAYAW